MERLIHELLKHKQLVLSSSAMDQDHIAVSVSQYRDYNRTTEDPKYCINQNCKINVSTSFILT